MGTTLGTARCPTTRLGSEHEKQHDLIVLQGRLANEPARILIDSGATHDFVSRSFLDRAKVAFENREALECTVGGKVEKVPISGSATLPLRIGSYRQDRPFLVLDLHVDAILGKPFLTQLKADVDWQAHVVKLFYNGQEHVLVEASANPETPASGAATFSARALAKQIRLHNVEVYAVHAKAVEAAAADDADARGGLEEQQPRTTTAPHGTGAAGLDPKNPGFRGLAGPRHPSAPCSPFRP